MSAPTRKLAAILAADVAGYSKLMGEDETGTQHVHERFLDGRELRRDQSDLAQTQPHGLGLGWRLRGH